MSTRKGTLEQQLLEQREEFLRARPGFSVDNIGYSLGKGNDCVRVDMHGREPGQFNNRGYSPGDYGCGTEKELRHSIASVLASNGMPKTRPPKSPKDIF